MAGQDTRDEIISNYLSMREELMAAIGGLTVAQMTEESLDGWSVKDHLAHLTVWDEIRRFEIERIGAGHETAWRHMTEEQNENLNQITVQLRRLLSLEQVLAEFQSSRQRVLDVIATAPERALDGSFYGEAGLRSTHEGPHARWIRAWREKRGI